MTQKERMEKGLVYYCADSEIMDDQVLCLEKLYDYNQTRPLEGEKRIALLKSMFASVGEGAYIEPPLHANWGGKRVHLGKNVYANFNLTLVDDAPIYIGNDCMLGPNVVIATAGHPIDPELRAKVTQYNKEVHIGNNVWLGAGVVVMPGVTIGDNSVIGAGSIVTRDIPSGVVAFGNPCKVFRQIGEKDKKYFYKNEEIDWENLI
ncbi:MAG: sugar O-acetyltransferase [Clostridia bacterium]|nr:sugar O-acetyltransferase [Clostridia bacterium]